MRERKRERKKRSEKKIPGFCRLIKNGKKTWFHFFEKSPNSFFFFFCERRLKKMIFQIYFFSFAWCRYFFVDKFEEKKREKKEIFIPPFPSLKILFHLSIREKKIILKTFFL